MSGHRQESCGHCGPLAGQTSQGHPSPATAEIALVQREGCCWVLREVLGVERVVACLEVLGVNSDRVDGC